MLDKAFIEKQKQRLLAKREELESELQEFEDKKQDFGQDEDDNIHETEIYSSNIQIHKILEKQLNEVNDALKRIGNGKYGICEKTKQPIDKARLEAVPEARYAEGVKE